MPILAGDLDNLLPQDTYEHQILIGKLTDNKKLERASMDKRPLNGHGRQLIDLCKTTGMMIFNGRLGNDCGTGKFTRIQGASAGVVDYAFGSTTLFDKIIELMINFQNPTMSLCHSLYQVITCQNLKHVSTNFAGRGLLDISGPIETSQWLKPHLMTNVRENSEACFCLACLNVVAQTTSLKNLMII